MRRVCIPAFVSVVLPRKCSFPILRAHDSWRIHCNFLPTRLETLLYPSSTFSPRPSNPSDSLRVNRCQIEHELRQRTSMLQPCILICRGPPLQPTWSVDRRLINRLREHFNSKPEPVPRRALYRLAARNGGVTPASEWTRSKPRTVIPEKPESHSIPYPVSATVHEEILPDGTGGAELLEL